MWIDATIAFGGVFLVGVIAMTLHWWLGRQERARREREDPHHSERSSP